MFNWILMAILLGSGVNQLAIAQPSTSVTLTGLMNGAAYSSGTSITLMAQSNAPVANGKYINFYQGNTRIGQCLVTGNISTACTSSWRNVQAGNYTLTAVIGDANGNNTTMVSGAISITVVDTPAAHMNIVASSH